MKYLYYIFFLGCLSIAYGQSEKQLLNWVDTQFKKGNGVLQGTPYQPVFLDRTNPFLDERSYTTGTLYYFHQPYYDQEISLDIYESAISIRKIINSREMYIKLFEENVDSVLIEQRKFMLKKHDGKYKIHEELYSNNILSLYVEYEKTEYINRHNVSQFKAKIGYKLEFDNNIYSVSSRKSYYKAFVQFKPEIKEYITKENLDFDTNEGHKSLIQFIAAIL